MTTKSLRNVNIQITLWMVVFVFTIFNFITAAAADDLTEDDASFLASPFTLYQSTISKADGQRCPMYPSCSHYAAQAVERHGKILGWLLTADRLLRCGRDETRRVPKVMVNGNRRAYDPLEANTSWWSSP